MSDGLGHIVVFGERAVRATTHVDDQRAAALLAHAPALLRSKTVDLTFDSEQDIDALDRFGGDQRLAEPPEIDELAPAMCPARSFDDRTWLAIGLVEPAEAGMSTPA